MQETGLDLIRYEIFYNKLNQILNEGKEVIRYLSGSTITREAGEVLQGFYTPSGEAVDVACGILMHTQNVTRVVQYMREKRYDEDIGIYDGDHFVNNDAFIGGMHVPDTSVVAPFFYGDRQLGWIAGISHTTETGGIEPGGMCPSATEAFHDGLHLPATKLIERGKMRRDVFNLVLRGTRDPNAMELDLRARIAGNERVRQRLAELADDFGPDFFLAAIEQLVKDAENGARTKFKSFRPGVYTARCYSDAPGAGLDKIMIIQVEIEVLQDGDLSIRVPVVTPQIPGYNNCYLPATEATVFYTLLVTLLSDTRWNSGIARPVKLEVLENSILNASKNQSVGYCTVGNGAIFCHCLIEALSRACHASGLYEEIQAGAAAVINNGGLMGMNELGKPFGNFMLSLQGMGSGARLDRDGINSTVTMWNPWSYIPDNEAMEALMPALVLDYKQRPDSGGAGRYRGGTGLKGTYMIHKAVSCVSLGIGTGGYLPSAQGLFGGYPPGANFHDQLNDSGMLERMKKGASVPLDIEDAKEELGGRYIPGHPSVPAHPVKTGDLLGFTSNGGGGLGDPIERDPDSIVPDIENGVVSLDMAYKVHCVSIDSESLKVDYQGTEELRQSKREERLNKGIPGSEYLKAMVERRRKRDLPKRALEFMKEMMGFSSAFREDIEMEEKLAQKDFAPLTNVNVKDVLFKLTPYVNIVADQEGKKIAVCSQCGFAYCRAKNNYKFYCLIYDRDPQEIYPGSLAYSKEWCICREFYCPGCATQLEVEATPEGTPILQNAKLNKGV